LAGALDEGLQMLALALLLVVLRCASTVLRTLLLERRIVAV